jgi:hypothetical protein
MGFIPKKNQLMHTFPPFAPPTKEPLSLLIFSAFPPIVTRIVNFCISQIRTEIGLSERLHPLHILENQILLPVHLNDSVAQTLLQIFGCSDSSRRREVCLKEKSPCARAIAHRRCCLSGSLAQLLVLLHLLLVVSKQRLDLLFCFVPNRTNLAQFFFETVDLVVGLFELSLGLLTLLRHRLALLRHSLTLFGHDVLIIESLKQLLEDPRLDRAVGLRAGALGANCTDFLFLLGEKHLEFSDLMLQSSDLIVFFVSKLHVLTGVLGVVLLQAVLKHPNFVLRCLLHAALGLSVVLERADVSEENDTRVTSHLEEQREHGICVGFVHGLSVEVVLNLLTTVDRLHVDPGLASAEELVVHRVQVIAESVAEHLGSESTKEDTTSHLVLTVCLDCKQTIVHPGGLNQHQPVDNSIEGDEMAEVMDPLSHF